MDLTPNIGLGKPLPGESYDIAVHNNNSDVIDGAINTLNQGAGGSIGWTDVSAQVSLRTDVGGSAAAGTSIALARACKIGRTVIFYGKGDVGATAVANGCVMLPVAFHGLPPVRMLECGILITSVATTSTNTARMVPARDRVINHTIGGGFISFPATTEVYWHLIYEV